MGDRRVSGGRAERGTGHTVNKHVARCTWEGSDQTIEFTGEVDLAAEARGICEAKGHVEHVVLVILAGWIYDGPVARRAFEARCNGRDGIGERAIAEKRRREIAKGAD